MGPPGSTCERWRGGGWGWGLRIQCDGAMMLDKDRLDMNVPSQYPATFEGRIRLGS